MANSNPQVSLKQHYQEMPLYRFLWMILPLVLIPLGGLLGGIIGAVAAFGNFKLAEYDSLSGAKLYFLTGFVTVGAFLTWTFLATAIVSLF
jgi:hypothetical protein